MVNQKSRRLISKIIIIIILLIFLYFEIWILRNNFQVLADPDCICLEANWHDIIKNKDETSIIVNKKINKLKNISIFKYISESKLKFICNKFRSEKFNPGAILINKNDHQDKFFYIRKGKVNVYFDQKYEKTISADEYYGENGLLFDEKSAYTLLACPDNSGPVTTYTLTKKQFLETIDPVMLELLKKKILYKSINIELKDLFFIDLIGRGKFGTVMLVHNKKFVYALKSISRLIIEKYKHLSNYCLSEKQILLNLDFPFIVKLIKTFKDEDYCYFLLEYINGISLEDYLINRTNYFNENEVRFYTAILIVIVDFLTKKNIVHRDIKPSNIIIDVTGYLKLIDFGTAKIIEDYTSSILGTAHYMAPEVILGRGYGLSPDYWSIGVVCFEIFYNQFPFGNFCTDAMKIYESILNE